MRDAGSAHTLEAITRPTPSVPGTFLVGEALADVAEATTLLCRHPATAPGVRDALDRTWSSLRAALGACGDLELVVTATGIRWRGVQVYEDAGGPGGLASLLFLDGVCRVLVDADLDVDQLAELLEVLVRRRLGAGLGEEDTVTLASRRALRAVRLVATSPPVEPPSVGPRHTAVTDPLPPPQAPAPHPIAWRPLPEARLQALRADADLDLEPLGLALVQGLLESAAESGEPADLSAAVSFAEELGHHLARAGEVELLSVLLGQLSSAPVPCDVGPLASRLLAPRNLREMFGRIDAGEADAVRAASNLVARRCTHPIEVLLEVLSDDDLGQPAHATAHRVLALLARQHAGAVLHLLGQVRGRATCALLAIVAEALPIRAEEAATLVHDAGDVEVQRALVPLLGLLSPERRQRRARALLASPAADVRTAAIQHIAEVGEPDDAERLVIHAKTRRASLDRKEAGAIGAALANLEGGAALRHFDAWLAPPPVLRRLRGEVPDDVLWWGAVAGLSRLPGDAADRALRKARRWAPPDLAAACDVALTTRASRQGQWHG